MRVTYADDGIRTALTHDEQELRAHVRSFAREFLAPVAAELDEETRVRRDVLDQLSRAGLLDHLVPTEYGGLGFSTVKTAIIREVLSQTSTHADSLFGMQGLGGHPILLAGNASQRARYLNGIRTGQAIPALAMTEPRGGSDVQGMTTVAQSVGDTLSLTGEKIFISNAGDATYYIIFAREEGRGISAFVVDADTPGLFARPELELLAHHPIGSVDLRQCVVSDDLRLGQPGQGFLIAMRNLDAFRPTVGAAAVGLAQHALDLALAYAPGRSMFGQHLADFQAIQFMLADCATELVAARLLVYQAARSADRGDPWRRKEASMAKLFATEVAGRVADVAVQIHGGRGLVRGEPIERIYREVRALRIYEGASEVQRLVIFRELRREGADTPVDGPTTGVAEPSAHAGTH